MAYVYRHIRLDKNIPFYIGIGSDNYGKYSRANEVRRRNDLWNKIVVKTVYNVEILFDNITPEEAFMKEKEFIALYGRINLGTGTLANLTDGGEGSWGQVATDKQRESTRIRATGNKYCVGRVLSDDTKKKIADAIKGQKPTNNKPVVQYSMNGELVFEYESANEAERKTGIHASNITAALNNRNGGKRVLNKFIWRYKNEVMDEKGMVKSKIIINDSDIYKGRSVESRRGGSKLNVSQVIEIRNSTLSALELSKMYKVTRTQIYSILNNEQWKL